MKIIDNYLDQCGCLHTAGRIQKNTYFILIILLCLCLTGCNRVNDNNNNQELESVIVTEAASPTINAFNNTQTEENKASKEEIIKGVQELEEVNYSDCFDGINGCAVFFNSSTNVYKMYNKELCEKRSSPCSTFKIISTLMGLENGVIKTVDSTMDYDGTIYPNDAWNYDLSLKDAFKESCVWYFRKVINKIGQSDVQKWIDKLGYGNCDISEWGGNGWSSLPDLNGFWIESSLKISPKEQVDILADIFDGKTDFKKQNIAILKNVMLIQKGENISIYGKTGKGINADTGNGDNGWFVGMFEFINEEYYFAVRLTDESSKDINKTKAKEIALNIIDKYYATE